MFDIRYHIASLVAVFLALTIGILMGSVIVDKGVLVDQQKALVQSLEARQNDLQEKNRSLSRENTLLEKFEEESQSVINGKLKEKRIAVIVTGDAPDEDHNDLREILGQAGANTTVISIKMFSEKFKDRGNRKELSKFFPQEGLSKEELRIRVLGKLVLETVTPTNTAFLNELARLGFIKVRSIGNLPADQVVLFGGTRGGKSTVEDVDIPLIQQIKEIGMQVIGVENSDTKNSYIDAYQEQGISTIDNADQIAGKIAMVFVLLSEEEGHYGIKSSAEKLLPSLGLIPED